MRLLTSFVYNFFDMAGEKTINQALQELIDDVPTLENLEMAHRLIKIGANPNTPNVMKNNETILFSVTRKNNIELLEKFVGAGCDIHFRNDDNIQAIDRAISCGLVNIVKWYLTHGIDNENENTERIEILCHGFDINAKTKIEMVELLMKHGGSLKKIVDKERFFERLIELRGPNDELVLFLKSKLDDEKINLKEEFIDCIRNFGTRKNLERAIELIKKGVNPNLTNVNGSTILWSSVEFGETNYLEEFANLGCDMNIINKYSQKAVDYAISLENLEALIWFLKKGIDVNDEDKFASKRIHSICRMRNINHEVIKILVRNNTNLLEMDSHYGKTLLELLMERTKDVESAKYLFQHKIKFLEQEIEKKDNQIKKFEEFKNFVRQIVDQ